jgi:hypothetical protein
VLLLAIQFLHTLLMVWLYSCLGYILYAHLTSTRGTLLAVAYVSVALEALAVLPLNFLCPLTLFVQDRYGPGVNDSFIPPSIAVWVMPVGLTLVGLSLAVVPIRWLYLQRRSSS